jgi:hypothetical protein
LAGTKAQRLKPLCYILQTITTRITESIRGDPAVRPED